MVVGFHFHQDVGQFVAEAVALFFACAWVEALNMGAFNHRGIVFVSHHRAFRRFLVGGAYHAKQSVGLLDAV